MATLPGGADGPASTYATGVPVPVPVPYPPGLHMPPGDDAADLEVVVSDSETVTEPSSLAQSEG